MVEAGQDALMGDERLREGQPRHEVGRGKQRNARLFAAAERLIEATKHGLRRFLGMEPPLETGARQSVKLADALKPEPLQERHDLRLEPQGLDGKGRECGLDLSVRDDDRGVPRVAGQRMGATQGLGQGKPRGEAGAGEACSHVGKQRLLAAEEVGHAGDVEPEPVIAVGIQRRAVAARGPAGEIEQSVLILLRRGGKGEESGADGARIGEAEARIETLAETCRIDRGEDEPALLVADEG